MPQRSKRTPTGRKAELSLAERQQVAVLKAAGLSNSAIARVTGRPRKTVAATLHHADVEEMRQRARAALYTALPDFAADLVRASHVAAERGRHEPALDALLHLRALEPVQSGPPPVQVMVGVAALPGLTAPAAPERPGLEPPTATPPRAGEREGDR